MTHHNNKKIKLLLAVPMIVALTACGSTSEQRSEAAPIIADGSAPYEVTEDYESGIISYTVQRGDGLGSIAEEFTGQSSNWRELARYNNISNPRHLREGAILEIPTDLIPGYQRPNRTPIVEPELIVDPAPIVETESIISSPAQQTSPLPQTSSLAVRRDSFGEVAPVIVTPANTNRDFQLNPIDPNAPVQPRTFTGSGAQIKVVGSYYPKGIYTEPAAYSKLIMRVAPGTVFSLDSQLNDWYKIQTNAGTGYIRTSDAAIVE